MTRYILAGGNDRKAPDYVATLAVVGNGPITPLGEGGFVVFE